MLKKFEIQKLGSILFVLFSQKKLKSVGFILSLGRLRNVQNLWGLPHSTN